LALLLDGTNKMYCYNLQAIDYLSVFYIMNIATEDSEHDRSKLIVEDERWSGLGRDSVIQSFLIESFLF